LIQPFASPAAHGRVVIPGAAGADAVINTALHFLSPVSGVDHHASHGEATNERGIPVNVNAALRTLIETARGWVVALAVCYSVKPLNNKNVVNYMMGKTGERIDPTVCIEVIKHVSTVARQVLADGAAMGTLRADGFVNMHTSYCSTPQLVQRFAASMPAFYQRIVDQNGRNAVDAALAAPHDGALAMAIPTVAVAVTHAFLKAFNQLPHGWYQGEKAVAVVSPVQYNRWVEACRRIRELEADLGALQGAQNVATVVAMF
jgi:hypothetical protein